MSKPRGFNTRALHDGEKLYERSVTQPIFQSSTYVYAGETQYTDVKYGRLNNTPNHLTLSQKISALEKTQDSVVTSSGMAAVTTALLSIVESGGHLLAQDNLYGGTYYFLKDDFPFWGREVSLFPTEHSSQIEDFLKPNTQAIYVETISNPLLKVPDLKKIALVAKKRGIISIIDNTFASPYNFNPSTIGFDVVVHSATKYLNGHTDVLAGVVAGKEELLKKTRKLLCHLGPTLDPHACFLLNRGIKTLGLRVRKQNENAQKLAELLLGFESVERVHYPGLASHQDHARARELMSGFGGVLSFEYKGEVADLDRRLESLKIPFSAPSLGGVESLVTRPTTTSHSGISPAERDRLGIKDTLVRVSVGIEDFEDLAEDFERAFNS